MDITQQNDPSKFDFSGAVNPFESQPKTNESAFDFSDAVNPFEAEPERGFANNAARGLGDRALTVGGNLLDFIGNVAKEGEKALTNITGINPGIEWDENGVRATWNMNPETSTNLAGEAGQALQSIDTGYQPQFTWENLKGDLSPQNLAGYIAEQGVQSIPDMAAALYTLPAYISSRTDELAGGRAVNNGREESDIEISDYAKTMPAAVASALLERFGAKGMLSQGTVTTAKQIPKEIAKAATKEAGTEFLQENIDYAAETLGTDKDYSAAEAIDRGLAGAVAGAGIGGAVRTGTSAYELARPNTESDAETQQEPDAPVEDYASEIEAIQAELEQAKANGDDDSVAIYEDLLAELTGRQARSGAIDVGLMDNNAPASEPIALGHEDVIYGQEPEGLQERRDHFQQANDQALEGVIPHGAAGRRIEPRNEEVETELANLEPVSIEDDLEIPANDQGLSRRFDMSANKDYLKSLSDDLVKGGGVSYIFDEAQKIIGRTSSQNPDWFKSDDDMASVNYVQDTVAKALAGERLGDKQKRVIEAMLDTVEQNNGQLESVIEGEFGVVDPADDTAWFDENGAFNYRPTQEQSPSTIAQLVDQAYDAGVSHSDVEATASLPSLKDQAEALYGQIQKQRSEQNEAGTAGAVAGSAETTAGGSTGENSPVEQPNEDVKADSERSESKRLTDKDELGYNLPKNTSVGSSVEIRQLGEEANQGKRSNSRIRFAAVDQTQAESLKADTGLDLEGYKHTVTYDGLRHSLKSHGDTVTEEARGQIPVIPEDFEKIPDIVTNYDSVELVGQDPSGNDLLRYKKAYNGTTYYVEEVRNKRRELASKTFWKTHTREQMPETEDSSPLLRPERSGGNLPENGEVHAAPDAPANKQSSAEASETFRAQPSGTILDNDVENVDKTDTDIAADTAATSPNNTLPEPTEAQKEAGNYKKGHTKIHGHNVAIENPKGSIRSGTDPDGKAWSNTMGAHYGYIKGTTGNDGDHVDVFIGDNPESDKVFVIDQMTVDGKAFDEHKVLVGFDSRAKAVAAYKKSYDKGWKVGAVTPWSVDEFNDWVANGDKTKPVSESSIDQAKEVQSKPWKSLGVSHVGTNSGKPYKTEGAARNSVAFKSSASAEVVPVEGGFKIKTGSKMTKPEAELFVSEFEKLKAKTAHPMGNAPANFKPLSVTEPELFDKFSQAEEVLGRKFWQLPFKEAHRKFGIPRSKWESKRKEKGIGSEPQAEPRKLDDFGEKLYGARKDTATKLSHILGELSDPEIAAQPLSKLWPKSQIDKVEDIPLRAFFHALRSEIPAKPKKAYRLNRWVENVKSAGALVELMDGLSGQLVIDKMRDGSAALKPIADRVELLSKIDPSLWKSVDFVRNESGKYRNNEGEMVRGEWYTVKLNGRSRTFYSVKDIDTLATQVNEFLADKPAAKIEFEIRKIRGTDQVYINRKGDSELRRIKGFDSVKEASAFKANNYQELVNGWEAIKARDNIHKRDMRGSKNRDRIGVDHRDGKDVEPKQFLEVFGFRGVEFGNWVKQGKQGRERQGMLNDAFDSFMDLATILDIPPKAISLNGRLGLGLGSRGSGSAAAHYETLRKVINLTKTNGAGSLAHEWFHALDSYFADYRGNFDSKDRADFFITYKPEPLYIYQGIKQSGLTKEELEKRRERNPEAGYLAPENWSLDPDHPEGVRPKVEKSFANLVRLLDESPMKERSQIIDKGKADGYWSRIIERGARAFETYVIAKLADQGLRNDHLANVTPIEDFGKNKERYPYLLESEQKPINEAFDDLFETIESKPTDSGIALYSLVEADSKPEQGIKPEVLQQIVDDFMAEYKGNIPLHFELFEKQSDMGFSNDAAASIKDMKIKGVYLDYLNAFALVAENITSKADAKATLRHELLGHYGLDTLKSEDKARLLKLISNSRNEPSLKKAWQHVDKEYATFDEDAKAEELFAHIMEPETDLQPSKTFLQKLWAALEKALRAIGLIKKELVSRSDLRDLGERISRNIREGRATRNSGATSVRFSQTSSGQTFDKPEESRTENFLRKIHDKHRVLKQVIQNIESTGGTVTDRNNAYRVEEAFHGKTENDLKQLEETYIKPIVDGMSAADISQSELDLYLIARHAKERNEHVASINKDMPDGGSGMTNLEAARVLAATAKDARAPAFRRLAGLVDEMIARQRDLLREGGLEEEGLIDAWEEQYTAYVPLKGYANDEISNDHPRVGQGFAIRGRETMRALGRNSMPESPLLHAIADTSRAVVRHRKNEVGQSLLKLVEQNPNEAYWGVFTAANPDRHRGTNATTGQVEHDQPVPMWLMRERYLPVKRDGVVHYIKLTDDRLIKSMANLDPDATDWLTRQSGKVVRFLSSVNTSYNPEFVVANFLRDIQTAVINVLAEEDLHDGRLNGEKIAAQMAKDTPKAVREIYRHYRGMKPKDTDLAKYFDEFLEDGAKTGFFDSKSLKDQQKHLEHMIAMANGDTKGKALRAKHAIVQWVEDANTSVENGVRLSAYTHARKKGLSRAQAASLAKNLTVNFNRKGEYSNGLGALFMFFNAGVQGTATFVRAIGTLKTMPDGSKKLNLAQKAALGIASFGFALSMINRYAAGEDEDGTAYIDKVPAYVRERNLVFLNPANPEKYVTIPVPYGYSMFHTAGDTLESLFFSDSEQRSPGKLAIGLGLAALGNFSPVSFQTSDNPATAVVRSVTPTVLSPVVQLAVNENHFGSPIYPPERDNGPTVANSHQSFKSTKEIYKQTAETINWITGGNQVRSGWLDVYPDAIEHLLEFSLGGLYRTGVRTSEFGANMVQGLPTENNQIPFLRTMYKENTVHSDQNIFYQRREKIRALKDELKIIKGPDRIKFLAKHRRLLNLENASTATAKQLAHQRKRLKAIDENDSLNSKEKFQQMEKIEQRMVEIIDRFNKRWKEAA